MVKLGQITGDQTTCVICAFTGVAQERVRNLIINPAEEPVSMVEAKQLFTFCALFVRTRPSLFEVVIADDLLQLVLIVQLVREAR
jgi:hypothetical protein